MLNKKGQGMAVDMMAAILIFLIIGGSIMFVWTDKAIEAEERLFENERIAMAERTLDTMIKGNGLPADWEDEDVSDIQMLGLAKRDRVLDVEKVEKFAELSNSEDSYAILKTKLLIGGNDYWFRILDPKSEGSEEKITTGKDWIEIEQTMPTDEEVLENTYDALNLFAIFAEEKGADGTDIGIQNVLQNSQWNSDNEDYPEIGYIIFPQCLKISVGDGDSTGMLQFEGGRIENGDPCEFDGAVIASHEIGIRFDAATFHKLDCGGAFDSPSQCGENGDPIEDYYAEILFVLDNCTGCPRDGFDTEGKRTVSGNLNQTGDYISAVFTSTQNFKLEFDNYKIDITKSNSETVSLGSKIVFTEPIEEIVLVSDAFAFSVKNEAFGICRGTEEGHCDALCQNGVLNIGEQCDGINLGGASCISLGFSGGTLHCDSYCGFNTSGCE